MKRIFAFLYLVTFLFLSFNTSFSQDKWWKEKKYKNESDKIKFELCKKTFREIGNGFVYANVNNIDPYFDTQVYLNVIGNEKGYYSSSQAELILADFMDYFSVENFKYYRSSRYNNYAFVNGVYSYRSETGKGDLKVTISLKYYNYKWLIDQINLN